MEIKGINKEQVVFIFRKLWKKMTMMMKRRILNSTNKKSKDLKEELIL